MQRIVLDYAWARPAPAAIVTAGAVGVCRYLSHDTTGKRIDAGELAALHAAGLPVLLVWEDGAQAARAGAPQGVRDARAANQQADALGWPDDRPIFYAVDYDVEGETAVVIDYLRGCAGGSKRPVRVYGNYDVVEAAWHAQFGAGWQTLGWSRGRVSPHACLIQTTRPAPLKDTDVNVIGDGFTDWGQHPLPHRPAPAPAPAPRPKGHPDMYIAADVASTATLPDGEPVIPWGAIFHCTVDPARGGLRYHLHSRPLTQAAAAAGQIVGCHGDDILLDYPTEVLRPAPAASAG